MALPGWDSVKPTEGMVCETDRQRWQCSNMLRVKGELDMQYEHYKCQICGAMESLDYDEMR